MGQPFDFDFSYTAKSPPSSYSWYKNGRLFKPDGKRVTVDHTGIIFTRIIHEDAGQYSVRAYTPRGGSARATSTLRGKQADNNYAKNNDYQRMISVLLIF